MCCKRSSSLHEINIPVDYCQLYNENVDPTSNVPRSDVEPTRTRIKVTLSTDRKYEEYKVGNKKNSDSSKYTYADINSKQEIFVDNIQYTLIVWSHLAYYQDQIQERDYQIFTNQLLIITAVPLWILNLTTPVTSFPQRSGTQLHPLSPVRSEIWDYNISDLGLSKFVSHKIWDLARPGTQLHPLSIARSGIWEDLGSRMIWDITSLSTSSRICHLGMQDLGF